MEASPSPKLKRGSPPIPPNYVSLRQLQELRLKEKEEQEKRQREEEAAAAAAVAKREAERKAEIEAMAAAAVKREAARKPNMKVGAVVSVGPIKEKLDGGPGPQWVAVANWPAVPPPARREPVPEAVPIGVRRGNKEPADVRRGGGKPEGKKQVPAITSTQTRGAFDPGKPAVDSSHGGKPQNKAEGQGKGKGKANKEMALGDSSAEPGSVGGSGESAGAPYRHSKSSKGKKGAGRRSAESSADSVPAKTAETAPPQGVKPENAGKPKSLELGRYDANPSSNSSDATLAPPTSPAEGSGVELGVTVETKPEGLVEGLRRPAVELKAAPEQKPRVVSRRPWPRPPGDRSNGTEKQNGRVWVPKAAPPGCDEV